MPTKLKRPCSAASSNRRRQIRVVCCCGGVRDRARAFCNLVTNGDCAQVKTDTSLVSRPPQVSNSECPAKVYRTNIHSRYVFVAFPVDAVLVLFLLERILAHKIQINRTFFLNRITRSAKSAPDRIIGSGGWFA